MAVNLADSTQCRNFVRYLEKAEKGFRTLGPWQRNFVMDMRAKFDDRELQADMGVTPWSPSVKQWNQLKQISEEARA